jgi:hypothetical protein
MSANGIFLPVPADPKWCSAISRLAIPARPLTEFDDALRELAKDLREAMHPAPVIGITEQHTGVFLRVVVLDLDANDGARTYINPEIAWASSEGSVSMPGVDDEVQRHARPDPLSGCRRQREKRGVRRAAPSATSTRAISSKASSGSTDCRASSASG